RAKRDARGRLQSLGTAGALPESWMQFVLKDPLSDPEGLAEALNGVLAKVRRVVGDWYAMRQKVFAAAGRQGDDEAKTFLEWIEGGHFTLMGHGRFTAKGRRLVPSGKGLGLLAQGTAQIFDAEALAPGAARNGLFVAKADHKSDVHRPALMDLVGVPGGDGKLDLFVGLLTADAYAAEAASLPWARRKQKAVLDHFGFDPFSHNGRLLANILETLPRDILFQAEPETLIRLAQGVLDLQTRSRVALFLLPDPFGRFLQALVYVPREGYDTDLRLRLQRLIEEEAGGPVIGQTVLVNDSALARLHLVVKRPKGQPPVDEKALEAKLAKAAQGWGEELAGCLIQSLGEAEGRKQALRYAKAFPAAYREAVAATEALADIGRLESLRTGADIVAGLEERAGRKFFKLARASAMIALSQVLPRLENLGFTVLSETPFRLTPEGGAEIWLHVFEVESKAGVDSRLASAVVEAFLAVWRGIAEDDGFNRLIASSGLSWRQAALLRALARYLIQAGSPASLAYMARTLEAHGEAARDLAAYFEARLQPGYKGQAASSLRQRLMDRCERIANADEDRILRRFVNLIDAVLRTNFFKLGPTISFKIRSGEVEGLPDPKPWAEIWVHGPRVEGIHLRGGKVARGGIRWSDRPEDFRTEILGLMKAQTVKNTVIVPVGAKGGFVVRQPPSGGGREALMAEGIACYQIFIRSLLELTDNLVKGKIAPPKDILRLDGDDPYLVVAADKGTASFSDIANAISQERGFWLGDAFASGGSKGYDHKGMGITARGAWISVQRHFREIGIDPEQDPIRAIGVGDMSGDVFGNGMLRSKSMKLVGAFDHRHIFIDPDPDPAKSFKERSRLFALARSSWADYDPKLISKGGGVFERQAKSIRLTPQIQALLGVKTAMLPPADLIKAILRLPVDLLWFGGIGTYVKAGAQNNAEVGDRANDAVRVDAGELRAKAVGEGANLALTQAARVAYALAGGRINTDAIDNSAGVDTSDHEVNIKILLDGLVAKGSLKPAARDKLLQDMTGEVAALVLRDNKLQTLSLSLSEYLGQDLLDAEIRLIRHLEKLGRLNRRLAGLPDDEELAERQAKGQGLARPELAELLAHGKIWLKDEILKSDLPDETGLKLELLGCFPPRLAKRFPEAILRHPLKRELLATHVVNSMINRLGPSFAVQMIERSGAAPVDAASAYLVVRDGFELRALWDEVVEAASLPAKAQYALLAEINRLAERVTPGLLKAHERLDVGKEVRRLKSVSAALGPHLAGLQGEESQAQVIERTQSFIALGASERLAGKVANLILMASVFDVAAAAEQSRRKPEIAARAYFEVGARFSLGLFKRAAETLSGGSHWQRLAR
ncbi:MAG: NAD-glutamate dehydrogenase, partial [Rhodospirillales bacterium]